MNNYLSNSSNLFGEISSLLTPLEFLDIGIINGLYDDDMFVGIEMKIKLQARVSAGESFALAKMSKLQNLLTSSGLFIWNLGRMIASPESIEAGMRINHEDFELVIATPEELTYPEDAFARFGSHPKPGEHSKYGSTKKEISTFSANTEESFCTKRFKVTFDCSICVGRHKAATKGNPFSGFVTNKKSLVSSTTLLDAPPAYRENLKCAYAFDSAA